MLVKSLKFRDSVLSISNEQTRILKNGPYRSFDSFLKKGRIRKLISRRVEIFQINLGKMCNQTCRHCHVDAGPDRKEIMTKDIMQICLDKLSETEIPTVDLTGGAPELNPNFRWFAEEIKKLNRHIIVRCNLTIIVSNPKFHYLPEFFAENKFEVISSLPFYKTNKTDRQRGDGVFEKSIKALKLLNQNGYGIDSSGLILNLVYNPSGAYLPSSQSSLEIEFKSNLLKDHGIVFNNLYTITNMPISRFLEFLIDSGNYESYMTRLIDAYNPEAMKNVMCANTISIGWDGCLYDCDFNQMLDLRVLNKFKNHISNFDINYLNEREIITGQHCFGCTAGSGSSCGGATS